MRHPFWIVNSTLLFLFTLTGLFIFLSRPKIPIAPSIQPSADIKLPKRDLIKLDPSKIYSNDLFDTYKYPIVSPVQIPSSKPMPQPPSPRFLTAPMKPVPKFLEPLKISLKGVIVATNDQLNRAVIERTQEKTSKNYKVGDRIDDAQLIRILRNKVILLRSNGQQETIYINPHDAELEEMLAPESSWANVIRKISDIQFEVDPDAFVERVPHLAQFIELLDLTTVYQKGKNIGCRIGKVDKNSLASSLGLARGDIIQSIQSIPPTSTKARFDIYKAILSLQEGDTITIEVKGKNRVYTIEYVLKKLSPKNNNDQKNEQARNTAAMFEQQEAMSHLAQQKNKYQIMTERIEKKEKEDMLKLSQHPLSSRRKARGVLMNNITM